MAKPTVTLLVKPCATLAQLPQNWAKHLPEISARVLTDCNQYARDDTGRLMASARTASDLPNGRLIWSTPYARRVYYTGTPSKAKNPSASLRWCEKAKTEHIGVWAAFVKKKLGGG